jgi:hypothetical protein
MSSLKVRSTKKKNSQQIKVDKVKRDMSRISVEFVESGLSPEPFMHVRKKKT